MDGTREDADSLTALLQRWSGGDEEALREFTPIVYQELRSLARHYMRQERPDHTLQPTALVHELFIRLFGARSINWQSRSHFLGVAAKLMRQMLVDHARKKLALKRNAQDMPDTASGFAAPASDEEVIAVDEALRKLALVDSRKAQVVELKYFGGLTTAETADSLSTSVASVERDWTFARAWLHRELQGPGA